MKSDKTSLPQYKDTDLLTKMECCQVFCHEFRIGKNTYYNSYRPFIKFHYYGKRMHSDGNLKPAIPRIPYKIVIAIINKIRKTTSLSDPSHDEVLEFIHDEFKGK